jgi:hypothetical protein
MSQCLKVSRSQGPKSTSQQVNKSAKYPNGSTKSETQKTTTCAQRANAHHNKTRRKGRPERSSQTHNPKPGGGPTPSPNDNPKPHQTPRKIHAPALRLSIIHVHLRISVSISGECLSYYNPSTSIIFSKKYSSPEPQLLDFKNRRRRARHRHRKTPRSLYRRPSVAIGVHLWCIPSVFIRVHPWLILSLVAAPPRCVMLNAPPRHAERSEASPRLEGSNSRDDSLRSA